MVECFDDRNELMNEYRHDLKGRIAAAVRSGDEVNLRTLLAEWERGDRAQFIVSTGLKVAIRENQVGLIGLLVAYGENARWGLAEWDFKEVSTEVLQALVDHGWDMNSPAPTPGARPMILYFCSMPSVDPRLTWLLSHGASLEAPARNGLNALSYTAAYGSVHVLRALTEHGVDKELLARANALHQAAYTRYQDRTEAMALLVDELGADIHAIGACSGRLHLYTADAGTPLHHAVASGRREHIRFLLDRGARVTDKSREGRDVKTYGRMKSTFNGWEVVEEWFAEKGLKIPGECAEGDGEEKVVEKEGEVPEEG